MACEKDTDRAKGPRNSFQRLRLAWMSQKTFVQRDKEFWRATVLGNKPAGFGKGPLEKG